VADPGQPGDALGLFEPRRNQRLPRPAPRRCVGREVQAGGAEQGIGEHRRGRAFLVIAVQCGRVEHLRPEPRGCLLRHNRLEQRLGAGQGGARGDKLGQINQRHCEPAHRTRPDRGRAPGLGVGPVLRPHRIVAMHVKPRRPRGEIERPLELGHGVVDQFGPVATLRVFDLKRQAHVDAVEPDLLGVALLVPVIAGLGAGVSGELIGQPVGGGHVPRVAGFVGKVEQAAPGEDVVDVELVRIEALQRAVVGDLRLGQVQQVVAPARLAGGFVQQHEPAIDAAILVAPATVLVMLVAAGEGVEIGERGHWRSGALAVSRASAAVRPPGWIWRPGAMTSACSASRPACLSGVTPAAISGCAGRAAGSCESTRTRSSVIGPKGASARPRKAPSAWPRPLISTSEIAILPTCGVPVPTGAGARSWTQGAWPSGSQK